ncbi:MAG: response regulator transcription factor [Loktanella sp.]|nr:response regulator transcription factor [Loktanella sp.]
MHLYLYEPRDDRVVGIAAELRASRIVPMRVADAFFDGDLGLLNRGGQGVRPFLLADGPSVMHHIAKLRDAGCSNPIVIMRDFRNARAAAQTLDHGADDDIVIPLRGVELRSRINSIMRRANGHAAESISIGEVKAYFDGRDPDIAGQRVFLSGREHAIFQHLALNAHKVVTKAAIYDAVYGMVEDQPFDKVIDVYICKIRKKIDAATKSGHRYIETVHGRGYKMSAPERVTT